MRCGEISRKYCILVNTVIATALADIKMGVVLIKWAWSKNFRACFNVTPPLSKVLHTPLSRFCFWRLALTGLAGEMASKLTSFLAS